MKTSKALGKKILFSALLGCGILSSSFSLSSCSWGRKIVWAQKIIFKNDISTTYIYTNKEQVTGINFFPVLGFTNDDKPADAYGVSVFVYKPSGTPAQGEIYGLPNGIKMHDNGTISGTLNVDFENGDIQKTFIFCVGARSTYPDIRTKPENDLEIKFIVNNQNVSQIITNCTTPNISLTYSPTNSAIYLTNVNCEILPNISNFDQSVFSWDYVSTLPESSGARVVMPASYNTSTTTINYGNVDVGEYTITFKPQYNKNPQPLNPGKEINLTISPAKSVLSFDTGGESISIPYTAGTTANATVVSDVPYGVFSMDADAENNGILISQTGELTIPATLAVRTDPYYCTVKWNKTNYSETTQVFAITLVAPPSP